MPKPSPYPNEVFKSVEEYGEFAVAHQAFGAAAYTLKKKLDKLRAIPEPKVGPAKLTEAQKKEQSIRQANGR